MPSNSLDFRKIEEKWQKRWEEARIFEADLDPSRPKFFLTVAYPYVNAPQHIGHGRTYSLTDVYARYKRMRGFNVLYPQGFHYTGTPILAMAKRVTNNDHELIKEFQGIYRVPPDVVRSFSDPMTLAKYFHNELKLGMKEMGYSVDWRREFTTIDPVYKKFIEWQFRRLSSGGYLVQGTHPVGWCPSDNSPVGQHDTQGDVEPEIAEVSLVKFVLEGGLVMPVTTYRPETLFGVTNIWVNPEVNYQIALVNGVKWIASKECHEKLKYQARKIVFLDEVISGSELVGRTASNPLTHQSILVLPASFVDPKTGTGVVMSVPGHAPYDYLALVDLKKDNVLAQLSKKYGLDANMVKQISPISMIKVEGYSDLPAVHIVERMNIKSQMDPKAEEATKEVYLKEYNEGLMKDNTGKYAGMKVSIAKDQVRVDLESAGLAEKFYELTNHPVFCRCQTECVVKIVENQWFINYGDLEWKRKVHEHLERMRIIPEDLRQEYRNVIDWLRYRACARRSGLGTNLPQDPSWIIESLSDSTIYMAYYTIAKHVREAKLSEGQFNDDVFDYLFLGKGDPTIIAEKTSLPANISRQMRKEFLYWYPLDSRHSGTDLVPNHLTFFIFNHVAIFPENLWPRQIVNNGMVQMEGKKMSKSIGNTIPIRDAIRRYGADTIRIAVLGSAELLSDANFSNSIADSIKERLQRFYDFIGEISSKTSHSIARSGTKAIPSLTSTDTWMLSILQGRIAQATEAMETCQVREAIQQSFFMLDIDLGWYLKRISAEKTTRSGSNKIKTATSDFVLNRIADAWIRLLTPFAPHICEEVWEKFGGKGFASTANWPSPDKSLINIEAEEKESYLMRVIEDTREIIKVTGIKPKTIFYYASPKWMHEVYKLMLSATLKGEVTSISSIIREALSKPFAKGYEKAISKYVQNTYNSNIRTMPRSLVERRLNVELNEGSVLIEAESLVKAQFSVEVRVFDAEKKEIQDPARRAPLAQPYRPSIYIEG
jgi:leucyl-tRNA synthetase